MLEHRATEVAQTKAQKNAEGRRQRDQDKAKASWLSVDNPLKTYHTYLHMKGRHKNKEMRAALEYAEAHGWSVEPAGKSAHAWGTLLCPENDADCRGQMFCRISIWGTPRSPENDAKKIRRAVDKCIHKGEDDD